MSMIRIDPVTGGRPVPSGDRAVLLSVLGEPLADVGQAPRLLAQAALNGMRRHADGLPPGADLFAEAALLFAGAELDGESPEEYVAWVTLSTGLTATTVRLAVTDLCAEITSLPGTTAAELPATDFGQGFCTRWVPRGRVFAGVMASNHPVPNSTWVQALFHGYSVLVRPGSRDPFTPRRLVSALLRAGLAPHRLAFLPGPHEVGEFLLRQADRGIMYGGKQAVRTWRGDERVAVRGPGSTKAFLDTGLDDRLLDHLAASAAFDGGTRCTNLSAVLTTRPVAEVADLLARRLCALPVLPAHHPSASLLVVAAERAEQLRLSTDRLRTGLTDHSARHDPHEPLVRLDDGSYLPRPLVLAADRADHPDLGTELPFPFVIVAPWTEADGTAPMRDSLVLNLLTDREDIAERAVREPSVRKVTRGAVLPWTAVAGIPHDDNYTQFLLEPKGVVGDIRSKAERHSASA
ncbi:aldehyde dehydrogenase family protein [Streptomyces sp. H27-D2]|uniref:aldehyde dehydrogenase family protein n=1 Tax=Streptomyces sp. H27-D2 TaxID=3046304 RepID=UPI002DBF6A6D|nr:aldehyde dehydrogenase family protein [Streptomyces sp. H27-D2]MEC4019659.1 aldehyde dehydrogenase family protein [Streptomyces sp. H27-D2]